MFAALPVLAGCAGQTSARPAARGGPLVLTFQFHWANGAAWNATTTALVQQYLDQTFNARTKGVRAVPWGICCGKSAQIITASLGGSNYPDVIGECCVSFAAMRDADILAPLDNLLRQDNIATSLWSQGHVAVLRSAGRQLGLPMYDGPQVLGYRQDILDTLGLSYPSPDWTYQEAAHLWQACANHAGGTRRYGACLQWYDGWEYLLRGFGGTEMDASGTHCLLASPACIQAVQWFYDLLFAEVITYRRDVAPLVDGSAVFSAVGGWDVFQEATRLGTKVKWNLLPLPQFPHGRYTYTNKDFWALNRASRYPDQAWTLLRWLAAEPEWQRFIIKTALLEPSLNSLWGDWEAAIVAAAPPLRGIALKYYREAAQQGYGIPAPFYTYDPVGARTQIATGLAAIAARKVAVTPGLQGIAEQIDALEQVGGQATSPSFAEQRSALRTEDARIAGMFAQGS